MHIFAAVFLFLALLFVGSSDYEAEKLIERDRCAVYPHPEFCGEQK